jgi:cytochrome c
MKLTSLSRLHARGPLLDLRYRACVVATLSATIMIAVSGTTFASGDPIRGENIYRNCMACHSADKNGIGPMHNGVFGSKAGSVANYDYSAALKSSGILWNSESLDKWLTNPQALVPATKMFYRVANPQDRADVIEFLRSKSEK